VLVGIDTHFLGFRHAGWYLPRYRVVQYPGQEESGRPFVSLMQGRRSVRNYALPAAERYVLFPLPEAEEYRESWRAFVAQLPEEGREEIRCGQVRLTSGPATHLRALYPGLP
jgi:hypothetical protein